MDSSSHSACSWWRLIVSLATSGGVSDIAFVVYAVALVVLVGLFIARLIDNMRARRGPPAGQP